VKSDSWTFSGRCKMHYRTRNSITFSVQPGVRATLTMTDKRRATYTECAMRISSYRRNENVDGRTTATSLRKSASCRPHRHAYNSSLRLGAHLRGLISNQLSTGAGGGSAPKYLGHLARPLPLLYPSLFLSLPLEVGPLKCS